ncbi:superoxide dismutase, partial [Candidatus Woesearchaeota archaeon]|nr:superoxide dismutase [Candidatus Woesearchaeota archaeon]
HEYYFANMSKTNQILNPASEFARLLKDQFGSIDTWTANFKASGAMRGIGWVISYYDPVINRIFNAWINEHDVGHLSGTLPLLIMDVFEHAYITDYGIKRADYIEAFFKQINWDLVTKRFDSASQLKLMF